ncbi:MAG: hypothetical protein M1820_001923 [Bogoriella megaspora]|nr:MAG: hypothetical protein M1820_001923 [Bogoriella megaspora]
MPSAFQPSAHAGTLHHVQPTVYAFEYASSSAPQNTLLFIPGLFNTILTPTYPNTLASHLPSSWRLVRVQLSSSGEAWGTKSLAQDVEELAAVVRYFRNLQSSTSQNATSRGKIAIMGHSTGCQDCIEYLVGGSTSTTQSYNGGISQHQKEGQGVDAVILQAPVSDREAIELLATKQTIDEATDLAKKSISENDVGNDILPIKLTTYIIGPAPISAKRLLSIVSPGPEHVGEDDYFSSDFETDRLEATFGRIPKGVRMQVLFGGSEEFVPPSVDKEALVKRWKSVMEKGDGTWDEDSGVVPKARHGLDGIDAEEATGDVCARVKRLLERLQNVAKI